MSSSAGLTDVFLELKSRFWLDKTDDRRWPLLDYFFTVKRRLDLSLPDFLANGWGDFVGKGAFDFTKAFSPYWPNLIRSM